jgi:DNA end-binding protein Ku
MARSIWTGSISFGLVSIPVKIFPATESHRVAFHELEVGTGERIHYKRVAEKSGHEVPWDKIEKGFEIGKGRYVMLSEDELRAAEPRRTNTIEIEQFVALGDIDPVSWDQTYYLAPDGPAAAKAYALLRQAMKEHGRVAIGRFVMRSKEHVVCIRPFDDILALQTMFFPDEVRGTKEIAGAAASGKRNGAARANSVVGQRELAMAGQLIESLTAPWDPSKFKDTFSRRIMELVRRKDKSGQATLPGAGKGKPEEGNGKVVDLMDALKATLAGQRRPAAAAAGRGKKRAAPAASRGARRAGPAAARGTKRAAPAARGAKRSRA